MELIDRNHTEDGTKGVIGMTDYLRIEKHINVGTRRVCRLMRKMGIEAIYPKKRLSVLGQAVYIKKNLLRGLKITHKNQVWSIDIT